jgi:hypothetical protein
VNVHVYNLYDGKRYGEGGVAVTVVIKAVCDEYRQKIWTIISFTWQISVKALDVLLSSCMDQLDNPLDGTLLNA